MSNIEEYMVLWDLYIKNFSKKRAIKNEYLNLNFMTQN